MRIAVYLGSAMGSHPSFCDYAEKLGTWIGSQGHTLVYGGASVGTMGILADAVLSNGGQVIGVMPRFMIQSHKDHARLTKMIITGDMSERKKKMMELSDCCIAMPGGPGTLEEVSEVISCLRLGLINHDCYIFNMEGYYSSLREQLDLMIKDGFLKEEEISRVFFVNDLDEIERRIGQSNA